VAATEPSGSSIRTCVPLAGVPTLPARAFPGGAALTMPAVSVQP
jgi:hypothetical protein